MIFPILDDMNLEEWLHFNVNSILYKRRQTYMTEDTELIEVEVRKID